MWSSPLDAVDLVTFTEEIRHGKLDFLRSVISETNPTLKADLSKTSRELYQPSQNIAKQPWKDLEILQRWPLRSS